jgi:hypothetical protein
MIVSRRRAINQRASSCNLRRRSVQKALWRRSIAKPAVLAGQSATSACWISSLGSGMRGTRESGDDLHARILNSRPVESITQPILEASASRAALAQLVEHRIRNAGVACSSHASGTISSCNDVHLRLFPRPGEKGVGKALQELPDGTDASLWFWGSRRWVLITRVVAEWMAAPTGNAALRLPSFSASADLLYRHPRHTEYPKTRCTRRAARS